MSIHQKYILKGVSAFAVSLVKKSAKIRKREGRVVSDPPSVLLASSNYSRRATVVNAISFYYKRSYENKFYLNKAAPFLGPT